MSGFEDFQREIVKRSLAELDAGRYCGYQIADFRTAFDSVKNPGNWKDPIDAVAPADTDTGLLSAAIAYYTGSEALFLTEPAAGGGKQLRVLAAGYYADIGS